MIPTFVRPFLWSYDIEKIDLRKHKDRIVINVFKFGTPEATNWVKKQYLDDEIRTILQGPIATELDPKSRALFELLYEIKIPRKKRITNQ